jgi:predicted RNA methylase
MSARGLAWTGLAAGTGVLGVVVALFNRVMTPAQEIDRYATDILDSGLAIARNLDGVDALEQTRDLGAAVPGLALAYLDKLGVEVK